MGTTLDDIANARRMATAIASSGSTTARSLHKHDSIGMGSIRVTTPIEFQVKFIEEPLFTSGVSIAPGGPRQFFDPVASVGVWKWVFTNRLYTGAYLWFGVSQPVANGYMSMDLTDLRNAGALRLRHHLCFEGKAIRDVDYDKIMQ